VASPQTLNFGFQQGGSLRAAQSLSLAGTSGAVRYTASVSSAAAAWLFASPLSGTTPASILVSVSPLSLGAGAYSGTITITPQDGGGTAIAVTVNLSVSDLPTLLAGPVSLSFSYRTDDAGPPRAQTVSVFTTGASARFTVTPNTAEGGNWLWLSNSSGQSPAVVQVSVQVGSLSPGTYQGQLLVAAERTSPGTVAVPVFLTVTSPPPPELAISSTQLSVALVQGSPPVQQQLDVLNLGFGPLDFAAEIRTLSGGSWLSVGASSGRATPASRFSLTFAVDPGNLAPGVYLGEIAVRALNADQRKTLSVTLAVSRKPAMLVSQSGLEFIAIRGGGTTPPQCVAVLSTGSGSIAWNTEAETLSRGGNWLRVSPAAGVSAAGRVPEVCISADARGLDPGQYYGLVRIKGDAANSPQAISILLSVLDANQSPGPMVHPTGIVAVGQTGAPNPAAQQVTITNLGGQPVSFASTGALTPASGTVGAAGSIQVSVQPSTSALGEGVYRDSLRLAFGDGTVRTVSLLSVVGAAPSRPAKVGRPADGCTPRFWAPQFTTLEDGFTVAGGRPVAVQLKVVDNCGNPMTAGTVVLRFSAEDLALTLVPVGGGVWSWTWVPAQGAQRPVSLTATAVSVQGSTRLVGQSADLRGRVIPAGGPTAALPAGVFNSASFQQGDHVALASWVSLFGENLAESTAPSAGIPYTSELKGTEVRLGDLPLPLHYVSSRQINALIPHALYPNTLHHLLVRRGDTLSVPVQITVAETQPGIYSMNQQGTGQGAIVIAGTSSVAGPPGAWPGSRPVRRGEYLSIYCAGVGVVTNPPGDGAPALTSPLSTTLAQPVVLIGGAAAEVTFSGLAPGFVGVYQINVKTAGESPAGNAVPLVVRIGETVSNTVTIAVE